MASFFRKRFKWLFLKIPKIDGYLQLFQSRFQQRQSPSFCRIFRTSKRTKVCWKLRLWFQKFAVKCRVVIPLEAEFLDYLILRRNLDKSSFMHEHDFLLACQDSQRSWLPTQASQASTAIEYSSYCLRRSSPSSKGREGCLHSFARQTGFSTAPGARRASPTHPFADYSSVHTIHVLIFAPMISLRIQPIGIRPL